jgi:rod shape determining protein RodA
MRFLAPYNPTRYGWALLAPVAVLCALGLAGIYASEADLAQHGQGLPHTSRQIAYIAVSLLAMFALTRLSYARLGRWSHGIYALMLLLLAALLVDRFLVDLPLIPSDVRGTGARRWIRLAYLQVQPSEFAKLAYVMALAWYLRYRKNYRRLVGLIGPFALTILPMVLILLEPDLGTVVLLMPVLLALLFVAGAKVRHLAAVLLACLAVSPVMFRYVMRDYQRLRLLGPLLQSETVRHALVSDDRLRNLLRISTADVRRWDVRSGYQLLQSKVAIGSGGPAGLGLQGGPYVRYAVFLPDRHNDFIFSVIANQWGLAGALLVLACFGLIMAVGLEVATLTDEPFARLLVIGMVVLLAAQALCNVGMTVGLTPVTGMTLPFVSFGGSSMVASFLALGFIINVAQRRPRTIARKPFEFGQQQDQ